MKRNIEKTPVEKMHYIMTIMGNGSRVNQLSESFNISEKVIDAYYERKKDENTVDKADGLLYFYSFAKGNSERFPLSYSDFVAPLYIYWRDEDVNLESINSIIRRIDEAIGLSETNIMEMLLEIGRLAKEEGEADFAISIYQICSHRAFEMDYAEKKKYSIESVLELSKLQFMKGTSVEDTLELERKCREFINDANVTPQGAMLMLYAGMDEQFYGNAEEGYRIRSIALKYIQEFGLEQFEESVVQLIGWHYHLEGHLAKAISYYERYTLFVENKVDNNLATLAYPAVIFGYFYTGEYEMANVLSTLLYKKALKRKDYESANLIKAILARAFTYMRDYETAQTILDEALIEGEQIDYGWGIYYVYLGLAFLAYMKGDTKGSRDALVQSRRIAEKYNYAYMFTSPFILDVLRDIKKLGMDPIDNVDYDEMIANIINSRNGHLRGVAFRHLGDEALSNGKDFKIALDYYNKSLECLEQSGDVNELGKLYLSIAKAYMLKGNKKEMAKSAARAWRYLNSFERENIPEEYKIYISGDDATEKLKLNLSTMWLDMHDIVDKERLIQGLVTNLCRFFKAESGLFAIVEGKELKNYFAQNIIIENQSGLNIETEYSKMPQNVIERAIKSRTTVFDYEKGIKAQGIYDVHPKFSMALPITNRGNVTAIIYIQSKFLNRNYTKKDISIIDDFLHKISGRINDIIDFELTTSEKVTSDWKKRDSNLLMDPFFQSDNEEIVFLEKQVKDIANTNIPILIYGETGTGKEVFANMIYSNSDYKKNFVVVNCGAIPESLMESELFGYEKGSFTGAVARKKGYFEMAEGGTIFLDEIGELSLYAQVKLLRVIQEHEIMRVGGTEAIKVNFRLIAATNRDLEKEVEEGRFRSDLYYRLNVIQFKVPALRERKEDIIGLSKFFVEKYCNELHKPPLNMSDKVERILRAYSWPGNIRELENVIQRAVALSYGQELDENVITGSVMQTENDYNDKMQKKGLALNLDNDEKEFLTLEDMEREYILYAIEKAQGKIAGKGGAAELLGLNRNTLNSKMRKLNIKRQ